MAEEVIYNAAQDASKPTAEPVPQHRAAATAGATVRPGRKLSAGVKVLIGVVVIALVAGGFWAWHYFGSYESTDDAQIDGHVHSISARVSGYVAEVDVEDNQYVEKGAVLVRIDPADYRVAVERAKAELADAQASAQASQINIPITAVNTTSQIQGAQAEVENNRAGILAAEQQVAQASAQLREKEADSQKSQADLARYKQLVDKQEISQQQYDQAADTAKSAAAAVDAARAAGAVVNQQVAQARSKLAQAQANLQATQTGPKQVATSRSRAEAAAASGQQKKAELEQAQLNLQYTTIVAPVSGVVNKNVEVGQNVQAGQQLLSIVPVDDVWVTANFKETQLRRMRPGQRVVIAVDAYGREYKGHLESVAGASGARFSLLPPENATGNYVKVVQRLPVKIVLEPGENNDHLLRVGMSVTARVYTR